MPDALRLLRRFATLCLLGLWLGGLTFYSLIVIRAAHALVGNHEKVGFVTQRVTLALNSIGSAALAVLLVDVALAWKSSGRWTRIGRVGTWLLAAAAHGWVLLQHARLDAMLDFQARQIREGVSFHRPHEIYLIGTAIEWSAALAALLFALAAWRSEDRATTDRR